MVSVKTLLSSEFRLDMSHFTGYALANAQTREGFPSSLSKETKRFWVKIGLIIRDPVDSPTHSAKTELFVTTPLFRARFEYLA